MMDHVKGWFWKKSSMEDEGSQSSETELTVNKLREDEPDCSHSDVNNSSLNCSEPLPLENVLVDDDSSSGLHVRLRALIKAQMDKAHEKILPWMEANTYLQREDYVLNKLTFTAVATIMYLSSLSLTTHQWRMYRSKRLSVLVSKFSFFGMWVLFLQREWYVALTEPRGKKPRTFAASVATEMDDFAKTLTQKSSDKGKD